MENNTNLNGQDPQVAEGATTTPEVDYKALYEKLQRDNANLDKYNKDLKAKYQAKLTDEEKAAMMKTGDEVIYFTISGLGLIMTLALGLMINSKINKKKFD